jgi:hypothetical protein
MQQRDTQQGANMIDALTLLVTASQAIFDITSKLGEKKDVKGQIDEKERKERKENIALYYLNIAATIKEAAQIFRAGQVPHGSCGKMLGLAQMLPDVVGDFIEKSRAVELADQVREAHNIERLLSDLSQGDAQERERRIGLMEEAAGYFEAAAYSLRASRG